MYVYYLRYINSPPYILDYLFSDENFFLQMYEKNFTQQNKMC